MGFFIIFFLPVKHLNLGSVEVLGDIKWVIKPLSTVVDSITGINFI